MSFEKIGFIGLGLIGGSLAKAYRRDESITVLGMVVGAAFCHNFGLASSGAGPTTNGQIAVVIGIIVVAMIAYLNTYKK